MPGKGFLASPCPGSGRDGKAACHTLAEVRIGRRGGALASPGWLQQIAHRQRPSTAPPPAPSPGQSLPCPAPGSPALPRSATEPPDAERRAISWFRPEALPCGVQGLPPRIDPLRPEAQPPHLLAARADGFLGVLRPRHHPRHPICQPLLILASGLPCPQFGLRHRGGCRHQAHFRFDARDHSPGQGLWAVLGAMRCPFLADPSGTIPFSLPLPPLPKLPKLPKLPPPCPKEAGGGSADMAGRKNSGGGAFPSLGKLRRMAFRGRGRVQPAAAEEWPHHRFREVAFPHGLFCQSGLEEMPWLLGFQRSPALDAPEPRGDGLDEARSSAAAAHGGRWRPLNTPPSSGWPGSTTTVSSSRS